jgi:hypothetical protein
LREGDSTPARTKTVAEEY